MLVFMSWNWSKEGTGKYIQIHWKHWWVRVLQTADVQILSHALCMVVHHFPAHSYNGSSVLQSRSGAGTLTLYNRHIKWRSVHTRSWTYYTYYVISGFNIYGKCRKRVILLISHSGSYLTVYHTIILKMNMELDLVVWLRLAGSWIWIWQSIAYDSTLDWVLNSQSNFDISL